MSLSIKDTTTITAIAELLYDFLPGTPHPRDKSGNSFPACAKRVGVGEYWIGGSKLPAITHLLSVTFEGRRGRFCALIEEIIKSSIVKNKKNGQVTREKIEQLNQLLLKLEFKIPELWYPEFLCGLGPTSHVKTEPPSVQSKIEISNLKKTLIDLNGLEPQRRGYMFEKFLKDLFDFAGLHANDPFRIVGEQIDGSFQHDNNTYLLEAKYRNCQANESDLNNFRGKVEGKAIWARGLFISYAGFTQQGLEAFMVGKRANIIGMDGQDLYFILEGRMSLVEAIRLKARRAAERNQCFVSVYEL